MSLFNLFIHSFSIIAVFKYNVFLRSFLIIIVLYYLKLYLGIFSLFAQITIILFNFLILIVSLREKKRIIKQSRQFEKYPKYNNKKLK